MSPYDRIIRPLFKRLERHHIWPAHVMFYKGAGTGRGTGLKIIPHNASNAVKARIYEDRHRVIGRYQSLPSYEQFKSDFMRMDSKLPAFGGAVDVPYSVGGKVYV